MESFTPTELRGNSAKVFNSVQKHGLAEIVSQSRPKMIVILSSELDLISEELDGLKTFIEGSDMTEHMEIASALATSRGE